MLAYLTAKTHGLEEEAENIATSLALGSDDVINHLFTVYSHYFTLKHE